MNEKSNQFLENQKSRKQNGIEKGRNLLRTRRSAVGKRKSATHLTRKTSARGANLNKLGGVLPLVPPKAK